MGINDRPFFRRGPGRMGDGKGTLGRLIGSLFALTGATSNSANPPPAEALLGRTYREPWVLPKV